MLEIPNADDHRSIGGFVKSLVELNAKRDKKYSIRWFCQRLSWSPSYINDLLSGRRNMTIAKAIELGNFLQLDPLSYEALIMLTMADHKDPKVSHYFSDELSKRFGSLQKTTAEKASKFFEFRSLLILELVCSLGRKPKRSEFSMLHTIGVTSQEIDEVISFFTKDGYITLDEAGNVVDKLDDTSFSLDSITAESRVAILRSHLAGALSFYDCADRPESGYTISQCVSLTEEEADLLKTKVDQLVQFVNTLRKRSKSNPTIVYQFCTSIFPHTRPNQPIEKSGLV